MLLTPHFTATQTETAVKLVIRCPYIKATNVETFIEGSHFQFHCKPYYLSLEFDHALRPDSECTETMSPHSASYDIEKGLVSISLEKLVPGTWFDNLDLIPKLLTNLKRDKVEQPLIAEIGSVDGNVSMDEDVCDSYFDWRWDQNVPEPDESHLQGTTQHSYGFARHFSSGFWTSHHEELNEIVQVPNPDATSMTERRMAREGLESLKFDEDYYMAGLVEDAQQVEEMMTCMPWWSIPGKFELTSDEQGRIERMIRKANKRPILVSSEHVPVLFLACLDLVSAYCYMMRHDLGEPTAEFSWSVSCITATLSCLEEFTSPIHTTTSLFRRSLAYPLYRSRPLMRQVLTEDVPKLINDGGRVAFMRVLSELYAAFELSELHEVWNTLWIGPMSAWVTSLNRCQWRKGWENVFGEEWTVLVQGVETGVTSEWNLDAWEDLARSCVDEEADASSDASGSLSSEDDCSDSSSCDECSCVSDDHCTSSIEDENSAEDVDDQSRVSLLVTDFSLLDLEADDAPTCDDILDLANTPRKPLIEEVL